MHNACVLVKDRVHGRLRVGGCGEVGGGERGGRGERNAEKATNNQSGATGWVLLESHRL